ncbi:hypothetical protein K435DRAFT_865776 [Dendrothele bispora CBS 962.96]|uniref:Uncharacterized protein n=1 Tax=Dendrothele bispora (strain CBS 962.96) TaxID=1314807 RepID=A0A4S8LIG3_DENBC|nr:hypothetical protein K435DRAFT_865776 [Dendrothele bispora CBS 962.96]
MVHQHVQPRRGRFEWKEVDPDDSAFLQDPRGGCTPPIFTDCLPSASQTNFRFYLVVSGPNAGIYCDWGFLHQTINFSKDSCKGFNDKQSVLTHWRWYCLHYHRHKHDSDFDHFVFPFSSPILPAGDLDQSNSFTSSLSRANSATPTLLTPTKAPKGSTSPTKGSTSKPRSKHQPVDPFTLMGTTSGSVPHRGDHIPSSLLLSKGKEKVRSFQHWVVYCHSFGLITTDPGKAKEEYLGLVAQGYKSPVMFGTDDIDVAMRFYETGAVNA